MEPCHQRRWISIGAPFMAIVLLATAPRSVAAQAQAPQKATSELQQLKDQLQQVDEVMQELKVQINALEETQSTAGSITRARASATRCCCPPEISAGFRFSTPSSPTNARTAAALSRRSFFETLRILKPNSTLSSTDICGNNA